MVEKPAVSDHRLSANLPDCLSDAQVFQVTLRILNRTLTETLLDRESREHREFSRQLLREVRPRAGGSELSSVF